MAPKSTELRQIHDLAKAQAAGSGDLFTGRLRLHHGSRVHKVTVADDHSAVHVHTDKMPSRTPVVTYKVRITKAKTLGKDETVLFSERGVSLVGAVAQ